MKTWILLAASAGAAVFLYDSDSEDVSLIKRVPSMPATGRVEPEEKNGSDESQSEAFARRLALEMDGACAAGKNAKLAVFADGEMFSAILENISRETRSALVRTFKVPALAADMASPGFPVDSWVATRILRSLKTVAAA